MLAAVAVCRATEGDQAQRRAAALLVVETLLAPPPGPYGRIRRRSRRRDGAIAWEAPITFAARPGRGGRRPRLAKGFETEATRECSPSWAIRRRTRTRAPSCTSGAWGSVAGGILAARLSTEDLQHGETAMRQVHVLREMAERLSLPVGFIIVALKTSGALPYDERLDFAFIASQINAGATTYVAFR
jgi:hypothetical protein